MSEIQIMKDQLSGLVESGKALREKERLFIKINGINEEIEKARHGKESVEKNLSEAKAKLKNLTTKKSDAVSKTFNEIISKMNEILPVGSAIFESKENGNFYIGWKVEGKEKPYNGLSGGEKQVFDAALAHVLNADFIALEAAELDDDHIMAALGDLGSLDKQVLICTCHDVPIVPEPFVKVEVV